MFETSHCAASHKRSAQPLEVHFILQNLRVRHLLQCSFLVLRGQWALVFCHSEVEREFQMKN